MGFTWISLAGCRLPVVPRSALARALADVQRSLSAGNLRQALREMDRAWRKSPDARPVLAHPYGRLVVRQGWDWPAAIGLLKYAAEQNPGPEAEADLIAALRRSGQTVAARDRLHTTLQRFAVAPRSRLAQEARRLVAADPTVGGWAARKPDTDVHAEATSGDDRPLLGVTEAQPIDFRIDGRVSGSHGRSVQGWARIGWNPAARPTLLVRDEAGRTVRVLATSRLPQSRWGFAFDPDQLRLQGPKLAIAVRLPDGSSQALPDSPFILRDAAVAGRRSGRKLLGARRPDPRKRRPVDVIIPVYGDHERTLTCIRAVGEFSELAGANIIVVDDASPERDLSADLDALAAAGEIRLLRNERNLGFAASVNRAMQLNPDHDAVLVNSDVVVFDGWLGRLRQAAYSEPRIGTVTPMADDDSIVGYASGSGDVAAAEDYDRLSARRRSAKVIDLPVGVGFCLYVRRDCWQQVGGFDHETFGRGYGEEADWCMRARRFGWRHVLATNVFVHHAGSKSFGTLRAALLERCGRLLNLRHPGYDAEVAAFLARKPLAAVRRDLDVARLRALTFDYVLYVTLALPGGVDRALAERARQARAEGKRVLVLQPIRLDDMRECRVRCDDPDLRHLQFSIPGELGTLRELLASLSISTIELHHTLGLDPRVIEMIRRLGPPIDVHIHDYSWVCPRVTMMDASRQYCGEPAVSVCEVCVRRNGSNIPEEISVRSLRQRSRRWLGSARRVIAPSEDTARRLQRYLPAVPIEVVPHEVFTTRGPSPPARPSKSVRVAVLGAIGHHKGYRVLLQCAQDAARRRLPLEFVIIGYTEDDAQLMRTGRVFVTGPYRDEELPYLLGREAPHLVFLPSVWPETWCYTLSHALASGLPVAAFDLGAIAERMRAEQIGTLFALGMPPRQINDRLIELGREAMQPASSANSSSQLEAAARQRSPVNMWNPW
jgi:GT2 family glycosyltransferase